MPDPRIPFDDNRKPFLAALSALDENVGVPLVADPSTGRLLVESYSQEVPPTDPSQNNPSYIIYKNAAGYIVKIEETIGATTYTTNIVPYDSDTVSTQQKSISPWT